MSRRMSCSLTADAVLARTKTVTRRAVDTWATLEVGGRLTLVEKAQGLKKGERQVVLAEVEIVDVRVESILNIHNEGWQGVEKEGLRMSPNAFIEFWMRTHGMPLHNPRTPALRTIAVRRIEWRYLDA
jgi:hypothetical protein